MSKGLRFSEKPGKSTSMLALEGERNLFALAVDKKQSVTGMS